jgi:hypothetical protein
VAGVSQYIHFGAEATCRSQLAAGNSASGQHGRRVALGFCTHRIGMRSWCQYRERLRHQWHCRFGGGLWCLVLLRGFISVGSTVSVLANAKARGARIQRRQTRIAPSVRLLGCLLRVLCKVVLHRPRWQSDGHRRRLLQTRAVHPRVVAPTKLKNEQSQPTQDHSRKPFPWRERDGCGVQSCSIARLPLEPHAQTRRVASRVTPQQSLRPAAITDPPMFSRPMSWSSRPP